MAVATGPHPASKGMITGTSVRGAFDGLDTLKETVVCAVAAEISEAMKAIVRVRFIFFDVSF
jgi:hypothetical protein